MNSVFTAVNPGLFLIIVGIFGCLINHQRVRQVLMIVAPILALIALGGAARGVDMAVWPLLGFDMVTYRVDNLSFIFAVGFLIASFLNSIYALHTNNRVHDGMALVYAGAAVAATLSGDLISLFVFWQIAAIGSVFLIFLAGTKASYQAGMRYIGIQVLSGVFLLDGLVYVYKYKGSLSLADVGTFESLSAPGALFIFIAFAVKAAFPFVHNWLQDSYAKASVVGSVVLSTFTTTLAVYAFARLFPGLDALVWIGALMVVFPVFFMVLQNDLRRLLTYAVNNQVGFMICAIGIGTPLAINGAAAHAFAHIIFQSLLFMVVGAALYRTGTTKATHLGGLWRSMPWTTLYGLIGASAISMLPLLSGFISAPMTLDSVASADGGRYALVWFMLLFGTVGIIQNVGLKLPYETFFGRPVAGPVTDAPFNMRLAMGLAAFITLFIGFPALASGVGLDVLYGMLPYPDVAHDYGRQVYSLGQVITQMQLFLAAVIAFALLKRFGFYPQEKQGTVLDTDWLYRKPGYSFMKWSGRVWAKAGPALTVIAGRLASRTFNRLEAAFSPRGTLARGGLVNVMAMWSAVVLGIVMLVVLLAQG